jgi:hypothetical protein
MVSLFWRYQTAAAVFLTFFFAAGVLAQKKKKFRLQLFRTRVARLWATSFQDDEQVFLADLVQAVNDGLGNDALFGTAEGTLACQAMTEANEIMLSENIVYKI